MTELLRVKPVERRQTLLHVALLVAVGAVIFLPGIRSLPLMDPEEPRCALIVREMMDHGDWIEMHLHGEPYYDKPAPYFWVAGAATWLTGSVEAGGRSVSALAAIAAVLVTYFFARRMFGARAGLLAAVILATSGEFAFIARWYRMEMPYAAAAWGAMFCFWRMEDHCQRTQARQSRGWLGFYALCGLATLFKGPVGLALPVMVVGVYLLCSGRPRRVFELLNVWGILIYFVIAAPWYVAVTLRDPAYAYQFFMVQNLGRYGEKVKDRIFYATYLPVVVLGCAPWTVWLIETLPRMWPRPWKRRMDSPGTLFLFAALLVPFVFFSLSGTKLVHYVLPVFPPAAILMGALAERFLASERFRRWALVGLLGVVFAVAVCPIVLGYFTNDIDGWVAVPLTAAAASGIVSWVGYRKNRKTAALACAFAAVVVMYVFLIVDDSLNVFQNRSRRELATLVKPEDRSDAQFLCYGGRSLSFEYYAEVELDHVHVPEVARLFDALRSEKHVYALVEKPRKNEEIRLAEFRDRKSVV